MASVMSTTISALAFDTISVSTSSPASIDDPSSAELDLEKLAFAGAISASAAITSDASWRGDNKRCVTCEKRCE